MNHYRGPVLRHLSRMALAASLGWLALAGFAVADAPMSSGSLKPTQIAALIRELGSERFATREAASDRLARLGLPAFTALEEATRNPDREIRFRAERILTVIRKNDLERRLAAFVAGTVADDYQLPAWPRFAKGYGDTESSRQLFVTMQRAEPELLAALERDPRAAVEVLGRRLAERITPQFRAINAAPPLASNGEIAAYLFVAAEEDAAVSVSSLQILNSIARQPVLLMVRSPKDGELAKKMVANVIRRCDVDASVNWIGLARELGLKEGLELAIKVLENHKKFNQQSVTTLAIALACVSDMGDPSHVPALEPLLENTTVMSRSSTSVVENGQRSIRVKEMQVRDAALAALVTLTKQDAKVYYGQEIGPRNTNSPYSLFPPIVVGFEPGAAGDEQRAAAHKKWADYKASQQKPANPPAGAVP